MTVVDWHPEELLDRRRALSPAERDELDAHLRGCHACRYELLVRADFEEELDAEDDDPALARLVGAAVAPSPAPPRRAGRFVAALATAAVLVAGSAAAWMATRPPPPHPVPNDIERALPPASPPRAEVPAPAAGTPEPEAQAEAPPASAAPAEPAASLFARANDARRAGRRPEAIALYRALVARYPDSAEAQVAAASLGRLLLESDDPEKALDAYDRYLDKGGSLGEEALVGRAVALQRLGRRAEERAAWQALLGRFPDSIHAARAKARLAELGD
jgi:TolA-binding protein